MKRKFNRAAGERLLQAVKDFHKGYGASDSLYAVVNAELSKGADVTWRSSGGMSALEILLTTEDDIAMRSLDRIADALPAAVDCLPVYLSPEFFGECSSRALSPVDLVCRAEISFESKRDRLAWLMEHAEDATALADPMAWEMPVEDERAVHCIPPLVYALQMGELPFFETFLERLEKNCNGKDLAYILNLRSGILAEDGKFFEDEAGHTVLHAAVAAAAGVSDKTLDETACRRVVSDIVPRLLSDGASPDERDAAGRTPYGLACELLPSLSEYPDIFRPNEPWHEFEMRDARGRFLIAGVLDKLETVFKNAYWNGDERSENVRRAEEMLKGVLSAYAKYESRLPQPIVDEHRLLFSDVASRFAIQYEESVGVVESLVGAGASPWYALPGRGPAWREAMMSCPLPSEMVDVLLYTPIGGNPPFVETMSVEDVDWVRLCGRKGASRVFDRLRAEREERGVCRAECDIFELER